MITILGAGWVRFVFEHVSDSPAYLVGDFNGWDEQALPMERQENGTQQVVVRLEPGEYEFKYKSGCVWFNDADAPKFVPNCWGSENSVVVVTQDAAYIEAAPVEGEVSSPASSEEEFERAPALRASRPPSRAARSRNDATPVWPRT